MKNGMTTNPVHDLVVHPREQELIVGTHGRGIYIADIAGLQALTPAVLGSDAHLAPIVPTVQQTAGLRPVTASLNYNGQSRLPGVHINYYLKSPAQGVKVRVYDGSRMIAEGDGTGNAGLNTVRWTMQSARPATEAELAGAGRGRGGRGGGGGGFGGRGGAANTATPQFPAPTAGVLATVNPGEYRVVLSVGGREYTQTAFVIAGK